MSPKSFHHTRLHLQKFFSAAFDPDVTLSSRVPFLRPESIKASINYIIRLYTRAGFPKEELQSLSDQLSIRHQNSQLPSQIFAASAPCVARFFSLSSLCSFSLWLLVLSCSSGVCVFFFLSFRALMLSFLAQISPHFGVSLLLLSHWHHGPRSR